MGINSKIAKIPFWVLYLIMTVVTSFNWIRVILFQKNFEVYRSTQPWDYYLSKLFADVFGTSQREYFIFAFPVVLVGLYVLPIIVGKLMSLDKKSNIKGENHVSALLILLVVPSLLGMPVIVGIILVIAFSLLSWMDESKAKRLSS